MTKILVVCAGSYGRSAILALSLDPNTDIVAVIDSDCSLHGSIIENNIVEPFENIENLSQKVDVILLCNANWNGLLRDIVSEYNVNLKKIKIWSISEKCIKEIEDQSGCIVHSQDGEEMFLKECFAEKEKRGEKGIYIDVGAYNPFLLSNTVWAYQMGWRGINIDPNPDAMALFNAFRPEDINICCGISRSESDLEYFRFTEAGVNTFNRNRIQPVIDSMKVEQLPSIFVPTRRLDDIFSEYNVSYADFIDIDVETMEYEVLSTIDFQKISFGYILVEQLENSLRDIIASDVNKLLESNGYSAISKFDRTVVYKHE